MEREDCLSRKAVLNTLDDMDKVLDEDRTVENYKALLKECYEVLTPVTPPSEDCVSRNAIDQNIYDYAESNGLSYANMKNYILDMPSVTPTQRWIPVSERLPNHDEYIKNNGLFIVSDGNRSYFEYYDIYDKQRFGEPTISGFRADRCVVAWMLKPEPYKAEMESEE